MLTPQNLSRDQVASTLAWNRLDIEHLIDFGLNHLVDLFLLTLGLLLQGSIALLVFEVDDLRRQFVLLLVFLCHESEPLSISLTLCLESVEVFL